MTSAKNYAVSYKSESHCFVRKNYGSGTIDTKFNYWLYHLMVSVFNSKCWQKVKLFVEKSKSYYIHRVESVQYERAYSGGNGCRHVGSF